MSDIAIRVEHLSKLYCIGALQRRHDTLRDQITDALTAPFRRLKNPQSAIRNPQSNYIWALKDVSFEVRRGEVVGIIGRNGAGKTTLLKVLSRITKPTEGRAEIHGRVGSLLEVGTGFHPELTGRENIYLNGAILGMKKAEIDRKFDEIVDFAEIEKFLDTPVKHYSSGMYVRLAFAVAAHLEPEILLVDEVLAVGDAAFQKKCLGKMGDVAREGRTVLFVSHNMAAIQALCKEAMWLKEGRLFNLGCVEDVVTKYQQSVLSGITSVPLKVRTDRQGDGSARVTSVLVADADGKEVITPLSRLKVTLEYESKEWLVHPVFLIGIYDHNNTGVFYFDSDTSGSLPIRLPPKGRVVCMTERIRLTPRKYFINIAILKGGVNGIWADYVQNVASFDVTPADVNGSGRLPPPHILCIANNTWHIEEL